MNDVLVFASVSVDGYAAGPQDDLTRLHRWMTGPEETPGSGDDPFVAAFRGAGVVVFGRRTYDLGQEPWGDDDVFEAPVLVVTHETRPPLHKNGTTFTFAGGPPTAILDTARGLARDPEGDVVIMGSPTIAQQFLAAGLVTRMLLHQVPVLLGGGIPMFGPLPRPMELTLNVLTTASGVSLPGFTVGDRAAFFAREGADRDR